MTGFITYDEGGLDRSLPTKNVISISERDDETDEEIYVTEDPEVIRQLWEWSDALASKGV